MKENWRDVVGYEGIYQVSNLGRVKSLPRAVFVKKSNNHTYGSRINHTRVVDEIIMKQQNVRGYKKVCLSKNGFQKPLYVHRIVMSSFVENPRGLPYVNHKDGDKHNNNLNNLEWVSDLDNKKHAYKNGLINNTGSNNGRAILNKGLVKDIRLLIKNGVSSKYISEYYKISKSTVFAIKSKRIWKHI